MSDKINITKDGLQAVVKYAAQLAEIFAQRQAIKAQFHKPTE